MLDLCVYLFFNYHFQRHSSFDSLLGITADVIADKARRDTDKDGLEDLWLFCQRKIKKLRLYIKEHYFFVCCFCIIL